MADFAEFTKDELRDLVAHQADQIVTIMLGLTYAGDERENDIRLKRLLQQAEQMLADLNMKRADIDALLKPAHDALADQSLFNGPGHHQGAALFLAPDYFRAYPVTMPLPDQVVVAERPYIKPLLPALFNAERFYVLTLSQHQVRLLHGTHDQLTPVEVPGMPESMSAALQYDTLERTAGTQSVGASGRPGAPGTQPGLGGEAGSFAGHGAGEVDNKQNIEQFFLQVEHAVHPLLHDKTEPLVLVGVEYLQPLYRQASSYKHITDEGVTGNPSSFDAAELLARTYAIVEPIFKQRQTDSIGRYHELLHKRQAAHKPVEVLQAAYMGQVDTLFVPLNFALWGLYEFETNKLEVHTDQRPGDADLLDLAAAQTLLNGGTVYAIPQEQMPDHAPLAAIYRYAL